MTDPLRREAEALASQFNEKLGLRGETSKELIQLWADSLVAFAKAQRAAVTAERDAAQLLVLQLSRDFRSPVQDHLLFSHLTKALAEAQARIAELEAALRVHLAVSPDDPLVKGGPL